MSDTLNTTTALCQSCQKNPATKRIRKILRGGKIIVQLRCDPCANQTNRPSATINRKGDAINATAAVTSSTATGFNDLTKAKKAERERRREQYAQAIDRMKATPAGGSEGRKGGVR